MAVGNSPLDDEERRVLRRLTTRVLHACSGTDDEGYMAAAKTLHWLDLREHADRLQESAEHTKGQLMEMTGEPCDCGHADHDHAPADGSCRPCDLCDCDCWFPADDPVDNQPD